jgi:predicted TIM-barrel fold metal-dependent hydrolase
VSGTDTGTPSGIGATVTGVDGGGTGRGVGIVDAHHHVWDLAVRDQDWITGPELAPLRRDFSLADLEPEARAAGVTATVLVQTVTVAEETPELLALAAGSDLVAGVVGWTDLTSPEVADTLDGLREGPGGERLVGIRHQVQGEPDPRWLTRPDVLRGLAAVADAGLVHDLLVKPHQLPAAVEAARRLPRLTFVLDHLAKPPVASGGLEPWAGWIRRLAALPKGSFHYARPGRVVWHRTSPRCRNAHVARHEGAPAPCDARHQTTRPDRTLIVKGPLTPSASPPVWSPRPTGAPGGSRISSRTRPRSWTRSAPTG